MIPLLLERSTNTTLWSREWSPFLQMTHSLNEFPWIMFPFYAALTTTAVYHSFFGVSLCVASGMSYIRRRKTRGMPSSSSLLSITPSRNNNRILRVTLKNILYWGALGVTVVVWNASLLGFAGKLYPISTLPPSATPYRHFLLVFFRKLYSFFSRIKL